MKLKIYADLDTTIRTFMIQVGMSIFLDLTGPPLRCGEFSAEAGSDSITQVQPLVMESI
jgi:hypothetical protein